MNISESEQVLTFDSVFMALQSQNFSFSKKFYSFSRISKRMLMSAIFLKKAFRYFHDIHKLSFHKLSEYIHSFIRLL